MNTPTNPVDDELDNILRELSESSWSLGLQGASKDTLDNERSNRMTVAKAKKSLLILQASDEGGAEDKAAKAHWEAIDSLTSVGMLLVPKSNAWEELHKQIGNHMDAYHMLKFGRTLSDANKEFWQEKMREQL